MKTRNAFFAALVLGMLTASACATFDRKASEQGLPARRIARRLFWLPADKLAKYNS